MAFGGLLLIGLFGRKNKSNSSQTRKCPFCAEPIMLAAIKCKHCGSEVEPESAFNAGWLVEIPCKATEREQVIAKINSLGLPILGADRSPLAIGPFTDKSDARKILSQLSRKHYLHGKIGWQD